MKKILLIDNFDSFTFNLVDFFEQAGGELVIFRNDVALDQIDPGSYDLLLVSPGPSVPENAGNLMAIIDKCIGKVPIFGVCLGHEALSEAFGGTLKFVKPVHGKSSPIHHDGLGVFAGVEQDFPGGRYHSLATDRMPDGFIVTATSPDGVIMAMRHDSLPIESVQFHPESVLTMKNGNGMRIVQNVVAKLAR